MFFKQLPTKESSLSYFLGCGTLGKSIAVDVVAGDEDWYIEEAKKAAVTITHFNHRAAMQTFNQILVFNASRRHAASACTNRIYRVTNHFIQHELDVVKTLRNFLTGFCAACAITDQEHSHFIFGATGERSGKAQSIVRTLATVRCIIQYKQEFHGNTPCLSYDWESPSLPFSNAIFEADGVIARFIEHIDGLVGKQAEGAAAIGNDGLVPG